MHSLPTLLTRRHFLSVVLAAFCLVTARSFAAEAAGAGEHYATVSNKAGLSSVEIQALAARSLSGRKWDLQAQEPGRVVGYLKHRDHEATVTLLIDDKGVAIYCVGWEIKKSTGEHVKPDLPVRWLNNIIKDLSLRLDPTAVQK